MNDLKQFLNYNEETGIFTWIKKTGNNSNLLKPAGWLTADGYIKISFKKKRIKAHRLAWFYVYGHFPEEQIDHKDGNKINNSLSNLRLCTNGENQQNLIKPQLNNKSGFLGVHKKTNSNNKEKPYIATIGVDGKNVYLGSFKTPEEAHEVYLNKKRELHTFCTI